MTFYVIYSHNDLMTPGILHLGNVTFYMDGGAQIADKSRESLVLVEKYIFFKYIKK